MNLIIHTDGGARGNPGPAAVGVVIEKETNNKQQTTKNVIVEFGKAIGDTTNNVAEYTGVIEALSFIKIQNPKFKVQNTEQLSINFFLDSTLVVNQLNGLFKVKDSKLRELLTAVRQLEQEVGGSIFYTAIPREQNSRADFFVNQALDRLMSRT